MAHKIFVGGLSWETTDTAFIKYFSKFGEITDSIVMKDRMTGRSRGFGFITFATAEAVTKVIADKGNLELDGRKIECKVAVPREKMGGGPTGKTKKIFAGGLSPDVTEADFRQYFETFGKVQDAVIMMDNTTGISRGFGFITFESEDTVDAVSGKDHSLKGRRVECKPAVPKSQMGNRDRGGFRDDRGPPPPHRGGGGWGGGGGGGGWGGDGGYGPPRGGYGPPGGYGRGPPGGYGGHSYGGEYGGAPQGGYGGQGYGAPGGHGGPGGYGQGPHHGPPGGYGGPHPGYGPPGGYGAPPPAPAHGGYGVAAAAAPPSPYGAPAAAPPAAAPSAYGGGYDQTAAHAGGYAAAPAAAAAAPGGYGAAAGAYGAAPGAYGAQRTEKPQRGYRPY